MEIIKRIFSSFIAKIWNEKPDSNGMVMCLGPNNIYPYQVDFGAAYLCNKLNLNTPDKFYDVCDLLLRLHAHGISQRTFEIECQNIHSQFSSLFYKFNQFDKDKKCKYGLKSPITDSYKDDLCYFVWHYGNLQWKNIARLMFNGQENECIVTYIKNIFINMCCFKVPKTSLSSLHIMINESVSFNFLSVRSYLKIGKRHIFQGIIQAVNCNPICIQNAAKYTYCLKNYLSENEIEQCLNVFSSYNTIHSRQFIQALFFQKVFSRQLIEQVIPKGWITKNFFVSYVDSPIDKAQIARDHRSEAAAATKEKNLYNMDGIIKQKRECVAKLEKELKDAKKMQDKTARENLALKKKLETYDKDYFLIKKAEVKRRFPILFEILVFFLMNQMSMPLKLFSSALLMMGSKAYRYIQKALPIYGETTCYSVITPGKQMYSKCLQDVKYIHFMLDRYYGKLLDDPKHPLFVTLAGDAAQLTSLQENNNIYVYLLMPLDHSLPNLTLHVEFTKGGSSPKRIVEYYDTLIGILKTRNIIVKYKATDGDTAFDPMHNSFFENYIHRYWNEKIFDDIVDSLKDFDPIPISDLLHLLKCARAHLINHLIMIEPARGLCVNLAQLKIAVELGVVLDDITKEGRQKDGYVLKLFSWDTFIKCLNKERFDAAYYLLPFVFLNEGVRSNVLTVKERLDFIDVAYNIFKFHYNNLETLKPNKLFPPKYSAGAIGTQFGDATFLKRCINTCIAFGVALKMDIKNLGTERIGTHPVECIFGKMRICSHFNHSKDNAISVLSGAILLKELTDRLPIPFAIKKRDNAGGVHLPIKISLNDTLNIVPCVITNTLFALLIQYPMQEQCITCFRSMLDSYSRRIELDPRSQRIHIPGALSGLNPTARNVNKSFLLSTLPVVRNNINNALEGYKNTKRYSKIIENQAFDKWSTNLMQSIKTMINHIAVAQNNISVATISQHLPEKYDMPKTQQQQQVEAPDIHIETIPSQTSKVDSPLNDKTQTSDTAHNSKSLKLLDLNSYKETQYKAGDLKNYNRLESLCNDDSPLITEASCSKELTDALTIFLSNGYNPNTLIQPLFMRQYGYLEQTLFAIQHPSCENENNETPKLPTQNFNTKIIKDFVSPVIISGANIMNMLDTTDLITAVEEIDKNGGKLDFNQEEVENYYV